MKEFLRSTLGWLLNELAPELCISCGETVHDPAGFAGFCPLCAEHTLEISEPACRRCGIPFDTPEGLSHTCPQCRKAQPSFDRVVSIYLYGGSIRAALINYKFRRKLRAHHYLASLLLPAAEQLIKDQRIDFLAPVPMHRLRFLTRGFSHTYLLAYRLRRMGLAPPLLMLRKRRRTPPLWGKSAKERQEIVKHSIAVPRRKKIRGSRVLLLDDIITTGATLNECARALKQAGAEAVYGLTVARDVI